MKDYNASPTPQGKFSKSYETFRSSMMPEFSRYERWCKSLGNIFTMKLGEKDDARISKSIEIAHLNVSSSEVVVFAVMLMFLTLFGGSLLVTGIWFIGGLRKFPNLRLQFFMEIQSMVMVQNPGLRVLV